jgi:hypothetical protein
VLYIRAQIGKRASISSFPDHSFFNPNRESLLVLMDAALFAVQEQYKLTYSPNMEVTGFSAAW